MQCSDQPDLGPVPILETKGRVSPTQVPLTEAERGVSPTKKTGLVTEIPDAGQSKASDGHNLQLPTYK